MGMIHNGRPPGEPLYHDPGSCPGCRAKAGVRRVAHNAARHGWRYLGHTLHEVPAGVLAIVCFEAYRNGELVHVITVGMM